MVESPSRMSGSGREAQADVWEWSGGPYGCPRVVRRPSRVVGRPLPMSGCGQEVSRVVGRPTQMSWFGREALLNVREGSGGTSGYPGEDERPSRMSGSGRDAFPDVREWSGGIPG